MTLTLLDASAGNQQQNVCKSDSVQYILKNKVEQFILLAKILPYCRTATLLDLWEEAGAASGLFHLDVVRFLQQTPAFH